MPPLTIKGQPAPVLPAMGLHSFHNDSPPFAGSSMAHHEPDSLSLPQPATEEHPAHSRSHSSSHSSFPRAVGDDEVERARSRRIMNGYRFGNPPSPEALLDVPAVEEEGIQQSDSPPLTEADEEDLTGQAEGLALDDGDGFTPAQVSASHQGAPLAHNRPLGRGAVIGGGIADGAGGQRRRSERGSRGAGWGMETLRGLNDREVDADASAVRDEHGSQAYLRGEDAYRFPRHRLRRTMKDESKIPIVIVACGSFSPPTYLHLRMFEMAKDEIVESQTYEIMAGYYSPVSSYYKKSGLAPAHHRVRMCELAVEHTSTWLMVDPWEAGQDEYQRTAVVLDHFDEMVNGEGGGVQMADGSRRKYKIMLLAGGDLIESFGEPGVWSEPDLHVILGRFGCLIVERTGSDVWGFLVSHDILFHHRRNVIVIKQLIYNDISSTKVRLFVRRGMSIKYLLPNSVIQYIHEHRLYREPDRKAVGA